MNEDQSTNDNTANDLDDAAQSEGESQVQAQPQDNDTPAAAPADTSPLDPTHPAADSNVDAHETYDEGLSGAAEAEEPAAEESAAEEPAAETPAEESDEGSGDAQ